jgi:hypothetical protein
MVRWTISFAFGKPLLTVAEDVWYEKQTA